MQIVLKGAKLLSTESETCLVVVSSFNRPYMLMTLSLAYYFNMLQLQSQYVQISNLIFTHKILL